MILPLTASITRIAAVEQLLLSETVDTIDNNILRIGSLPSNIDQSALKVQLQVFHRSSEMKCLSHCVNKFSAMSTDAQTMLPDVQKLIQLLTVQPATTCTPERTFSALRRLKSWLRSTMSQKRLNSLAVLSVHRQKCADLDLTSVGNAFVKKGTTHITQFGTF